MPLGRPDATTITLRSIGGADLVIRVGNGSGRYEKV